VLIVPGFAQRFQGNIEADFVAVLEAVSNGLGGR